MLDYNDMPALISGIDTCYYFAKSNHLYDELFERLLGSISQEISRLETFGIDTRNHPIRINIDAHEFIYTGKGKDGFHWFKNEVVRLGFKHPESNVSQNDIKVQLDAKGIYTVGLKSLIEYVNHDVLGKYVLDQTFPITRVDLNCFIQHDFSYLDASMIVSKKKSYSEIIKSYGSTRAKETIYVGKKPFMLRIYNKKNELKNSPKEAIMMEYFKTRHFDLEKPIFNVEFELHREFLKQYEITTLEQTLSRAEVLFRHCMDTIRIINPESINEKEKKSYNRNRAKTNPVWTFIKLSYILKQFFQHQHDLSRINKNPERYSLTDAQKAIEKILKRTIVNGGGLPTKLFMHQCLDSVKQSMEIDTAIHASKLLVQVLDNSTQESYEAKLQRLSNDDLLALEKEMTDAIGNHIYNQEELYQKYITLSCYMEKRGVDLVGRLEF